MRSLLSLTILGASFNSNGFKYLSTTSWISCPNSSSVSTNSPSTTLHENKFHYRYKFITSVNNKYIHNLYVTIVDFLAY